MTKLLRLSDTWVVKQALNDVVRYPFHQLSLRGIAIYLQYLVFLKGKDRNYTDFKNYFTNRKLQLLPSSNEYLLTRKNKTTLRVKGCEPCRKQ